MCEPSQQFAYKTWVQFPFFFLHRHRRFFYVRILPDSLSCWLKKVSCIVHAWTAGAQNRNKSFTHTEHRVGAVGSEGLRANSQSSLPNVYLRFSGFDSSFLLIHFRDDGPNRCSQCTKVWHRNYPMWRSSFDIGEVRLHSVTEITPKSPLLWVSRSPIRVSRLRKSYLVQHEHSLILPVPCVSRRCSLPTSKRPMICLFRYSSLLTRSERVSRPPVSTFLFITSLLSVITLSIAILLLFFGGEGVVVTTTPPGVTKPWGTANWRGKNLSFIE